MENNELKKIFKVRKISQFHLDFINSILDKILDGRINTTEAKNLLNEACIINNEKTLDDLGSIKKCVAILLKDKPEELQEYYKLVKNNTGKRNIKRGKTKDIKNGRFYEKEQEFKNKIIEHYLPLILKGEITFEMIEKDLSTSHHTVNKIIEEYYVKNENLEGLQEYEKFKRSNRGSIEKRKEAKNKRNELLNCKVVSNKEFILLSPEEQEQQLIIKIVQKSVDYPIIV